MMGHDPIPVFFHQRQLSHKPLYEWAFGDKLDHPETTHRAETIYSALNAAPTLFSIREPRQVPQSWIRRTHDARLVTLYRTAQEVLPPEKTQYPSVFPKRAQTEGNPLHIEEAGYFCYDSGTPLTSNTLEAAIWSASCAFEAARLVVRGKAKFAYGLCRPPGHHASRDLFGGYCYFNNAALIAKMLRGRGRVAIVDIDFHHGNGTQDLFYRDNRVLFISVHGDPREFYPFFSGYAHDIGEGYGKGFNMNIPLPRGTDGQEYLGVIRKKVIRALRDYDPAFLVLSAGFDTYKTDPIGAFTLDTPNFHELGFEFGRLKLPTTIIQEGGYCVAQLGVNVATFLQGFQDGMAGNLHSVPLK